MTKVAGPGPLAAGSLGPGSVHNGEVAELREQLREAQETIEAIRGGDVDSLMIGPPGQEQVYAVASSDNTYRLIVNAMSDGAATISPGGVILDANPRLATMTGRDATALIGTAVLDLVPGRHQRAAAQILDVAVGATARGEVELIGPGSRTVPVLVAVSAFELDDVDLRSLILTDVSAQRRAEDEVRQLNDELEARVEQRTAELARANKNLESFTYSVSHDLRSPLRALHGFSEALLEEYADRLDEDGQAYARRIVAASERMGALIDDLLQLSRFSRSDMNLGPVNLSAEVTSVVEELQLQRRYPDRNVRLCVQDDVWVTADRALIRSVVQNLIENAWKFTAKRSDAVIEFAAAAADGEICCYLRDNGAGFDPVYVDKLFQPFQRLHTASEFPGNGIGLASVQRIIERFGGRVWAEGAIGQGATFYFTLAGARPCLNEPRT
jgi:PAS domain S-box-containing protein